jgi:hypothetical protein
MKLLTLFLLVFVASLSLNGQIPSFEFVFSQTATNAFEHVIQTEDSSFLVAVNQFRAASSVSKLSKNGRLIKTLTLGNDSLLTFIKRVTPTSYGFLGVGSALILNTTYYLWLIKMDNQLNLISQEFHNVPNLLNELIVDTDRDSNVIVGGGITYKNYLVPYLFGAKVNKNGNLSYLTYKYPDTLSLTNPYRSFWDYMITMKDSTRHIFFDGDKISSVDSNFNIIHQINMPYVDNFLYSYYPTVLRLTDSTFYVAGKGFERATFKRTLFFSEMTLSGRNNLFRILGIEDTSEQIATKHSLDTTKNGDIYIGSTFNYPVTCQNYPFCGDTSFFVLHKMDKRLNTLWKKRYGKNGLFIMYGLLSTNDGGCLMYGYRYLKTIEQKLEAYVIKVDGNGLVTSETTIPIAQESITAFPNPSTGLLNFKKETPSVFNHFELTIFDISGKLVFQKKETDLSETFDLSHLATGNYIYQIKEGEKIKALGKWVKN